MRDRFSEIFNQPSGSNRTSRGRILAGITYKALRMGSAGFFLLTGFALLIPVLVFLYRSVNPDTPERVPQAERVGHAHGLGIDPADNALYITTTRGMYWIKDSEWAQRVGGDSYQDSQALIAVGPGEFLASGRPDIRDRVSGFAPAYSGLIRSQNAGAKWRTLSLAGEANFRALDTDDRLIFGYDEVGGGFMVSSDAGKTWETRSRPPPLYDFAVDPGDITFVYAITDESAPLVSRDGGRSWEPQMGPEMRFVVWQDPDVVWSAASTGEVYSSLDAGWTWQQRGNLTGPLEAFLVQDGVLYAAVYDDDTGIVIYQSSDQAQTWEERYRDPQIKADEEPAADATP